MSRDPAQAQQRAACSGELPRPRSASALVRYGCLLALAGFASFQATFAAQQIKSGEADFEYFYKAGRWVLEHGTIDARVDVHDDGTREPRGGIEWYLPAVQRVTALYAWMPLRVAGYLWLGLNLVAFFLLLRLVGGRLMGLPPADWPVTTLVPVLLMSLFWHWEFRLNQIDTLVLLLLVSAFVCWEDGRPRVAGFWLGLAVLLKVTPALFVLWFAMKRQFATAAVALATVVLAGPVADVAVWGPRYAGEIYREWAENAVTRSSHRGLVMQQLEMDWRNQGLGAVASRWLHPTNYGTHFDNDPRILHEEPEARLNVAALPREAVAGIVLALSAASVLWLLWVVRRPARRLTAWELRLEFALCLLVLLWLMPVLRRYHFILVLPAVCVLAGLVHYRPQRGWTAWAIATVWAIAGLQATVVLRPLTGSRLPEAGGVFLLMLPMLAAPVWWMLRQLARRKVALGPDAYAAARRRARAAPREARRGAAAAAEASGDALSTM